MKASFLRRRKMARGVLVLDVGLAGLEPHLRIGLCVSIVATG